MLFLPLCWWSLGRNIRHEIQPETLKSAASYVFQKNEEASALWNDEESLSHVSSHALLCCVELEADRWSVESCANMNFILWDYLHSDNTQKKASRDNWNIKKLYDKNALSL